MNQKEFVINKLKTDGFITRNYCLSLYERKERPNITRLGAIINVLNNEGWKIKGRNNKGDFIYEADNAPYKIQYYTLPDGTIIKKYEKLRNVRS